MGNSLVSHALLKVRALCVLSIAALSGLASIPANARDCFSDASMYHGVNPGILRAIAIKESTDCRNSVVRNSNNTVDIGCMQINSTHLGELAKYGVGANDLLDQCKNIYVGAWHYKKQILRYGNTWTAVGAYHSRTPSRRDRYAMDVYNIWRRLPAEYLN
jgi:lysozyme-related protein Hpa2